MKPIKNKIQIILLLALMFVLSGCSSSDILVAEEEEFEDALNGYLLLTDLLPGTVHLGSYQDKTSNSYIFLESNQEMAVQFEEYKVTLDTGEVYYAYLNQESSWYVISSFQLDLNSFYNQYSRVDTLPSRTAERIFIQKSQNSKKYTLTEESETLYYKGEVLFNIPNDYTTFPIYKLQIEGVGANACESYFGSYTYKTDVLNYGDALMCKVEGNMLRAHLNEKVFSQTYSEDNEMGLGYLVMRNILYPN